MLNETQKTFYVLLVDGIEKTRSENQSVVELMKSQLPLTEQHNAEIKQMTEAGQQVLWG